MKATIRTLRSSTKQIINAVARGDVVVVTNRGKPCAQIIPVNSSKKKKVFSGAFGMWKNNKNVKSVKQYVNDLRESRHAY